LSTQKIIYLVIGIVLGFIVGFALANSVNRQEQDKLRAEVTRLRADPSGDAQTGDAQPAGATRPQTGDPSMPNISDEKLKDAITRADANPKDIAFQKTSGQGLFIIAMQTGNGAILPDAARFLKRAYEADPKDYNVTVMLGNAHLLMARDESGGDSHAHFNEARTYYQKALVAKPDDLIVRTSLGLTYFYDKPSDPQRAIREYRKALEIDPRHEATLQNLVAALLSTDDIAEAGRRLEELQNVNSSNRELPNLRAQLEQKKNAAKEKD
jgi:tetratricopeptide (TPR) repeat protein